SPQLHTPPANAPRTGNSLPPKAVHSAPATISQAVTAAMQALWSAELSCIVHVYQGLVPTVLQCCASHCLRQEAEFVLPEHWSIHHKRQSALSRGLPFRGMAAGTTDRTGPGMRPLGNTRNCEAAFPGYDGKASSAVKDGIVIMFLLLAISD